MAVLSFKRQPGGVDEGFHSDSGGAIMRHIAFLGVVGLFVAGISNGRASASVTPGLTFTVASQSGLPAAGTHYHSNLAGVFGNPPGLAEVGSLQDQALSSESIRGLSEFDLTGLGAGTATLSFRVYTLSLIHI